MGPSGHPPRRDDDDADHDHDDGDHGEDHDDHDHDHDDHYDDDFNRLMIEAVI